MKSREEIKELIRIFQHDLNNEHLGDQYKIEINYALIVLNWILEDSVDGEEIISEWVDSKGKENIIKRKDLLCYTCFHYKDCIYRDDIYNIGGSCLADK